ncbi:uncharacterized protein BP01DRAFT_370698 [Aspergillus saccharolyticus JOP 1030-1]|uniref:Transposase Tc1-like domain-containing protein n=1 Tax=Aspergillus saccharolyticus JOP 1030-1 TaxID=1450539 RepID=A0A319ASA5_9EURO|nr:hypothetical protein BP01DRAFT_370698 [Aspergillus saccharolyticus JOP 1030-1]PYH49162.1 hypothetical protein BP01DRAFT_370698 [Aspergillus saccharolyticus JOP 1030-1]
MVCSVTRRSDVSTNVRIRTAKERGFDPQRDPRILLQYIQDAPRSGRPREITNSMANQLIDMVCENRASQSRTCEMMAFELGVSTISVYHVLKKYGFKSVKPTKKPSLTPEMKKQHLEFCLWFKERIQNGGLKDLIFTDETAVCIGQRRGAQRIWRRTHEKYEASYIQHRWKSKTDFMVWDAFSYNQKDPIHIFKPETAKEKQEAEKEIQTLNKEYKTEETPGRQPVWRFTEERGKLVRRGKGGINWY